MWPNSLNETKSQFSPHSVVDQLYQRIRRDIISGAIAVGSKINELDLGQQHKVSRSTVREAIGRLESAYLVSRKANAGARVAELSRGELLEIYQVRESLEGMACRLAAEKMNDNEIIQLERLLQSHMENSELLEGRSYYQKEGDLDFHYRLVQASRNSKLIHILCDELYDKVRMYRYQFGMVSPRAVDAYAEHKLIVQAIADRDGEMAEMLMRRHIRASRINAERLLA